MSALSPVQLARIESLGLNCEVGNVLRRLGNETPSLFRWTWAPPRSILALLQCDFAGLYEPENMEPGPTDEVRDGRYDIWFHTNLRTCDPDGGTNCRFLDPDEGKRLRVLRAEQSVVDALADRFRQRMLTPHTLFILTRHEREPLGSAEELMAAIEAHAGKTPIALLEVHPTSDPSRIAKVEHATGRLYRGHVARFAPHDQADDIHMESWTALLEAALAATSAKPWWRALGAASRANVVA